MMCKGNTGRENVSGTGHEGIRSERRIRMRKKGKSGQTREEEEGNVKRNDKS